MSISLGAETEGPAVKNGESLPPYLSDVSIHGSAPRSSYVCALHPVRSEALNTLLYTRLTKIEDLIVLRDR